ncbi:hypothetical protein [Radiobacillus sp. PE A8.2]|uniref:hypothetical protein n=1 Tax=Radiobacillus sp. PE A8.2 TaxID=3380349 RepID=UPI0038908000
MRKRSNRKGDAGLDSDMIKQKVNDWYHAYSNDIYKYAFFLIGDYDASKDVLQALEKEGYSHETV